MDEQFCVVYILLVILQRCETQATPTTNYIFLVGKEYKPTTLSSLSLPFVLLKIYPCVGNILYSFKGRISRNVFTVTFVSYFKAFIGIMIIVSMCLKICVKMYRHKGY